MMTKTLRESLALEVQLSEAYDKLDATEGHEKQMWANEIKRIRARLYKLPNYNASGLKKIMDFLNPHLPKEITNGQEA